MVSRNDSTGDLLISKANNKAYESNYDSIFRKDKTLDELKDKYAEMKKTGKTSIIQEPTTDLNALSDTQLCAEVIRMSEMREKFNYPEIVTTEEFWNKLCDSRCVRIGFNDCQIGENVFYTCNPPESVDDFIESKMSLIKNNLRTKAKRKFSLFKLITFK